MWNLLVNNTKLTYTNDTMMVILLKEEVGSLSQTNSNPAQHDPYRLELSSLFSLRHNRYQVLSEKDRRMLEFGSYMRTKHELNTTY
jgi:hypothetical protein